MTNISNRLEQNNREQRFNSRNILIGPRYDDEDDSEMDGEEDELDDDSAPEGYVKF